MKDLEGKVALVTGAAAGIGLAMAERFANEGMQVILADRDIGGATEAARKLVDGGLKAHAIAVDVTVSGEVEELADEVFRDYGNVHLLCNNAGVLGRVQASWEQPIENWRWVFDVNVLGVANGLHYFLPRMVEAGEQGYVLNTGSVAGLLSGPFFAPYNASKHAVVAMSECLHHELRAVGSRIEVGVLCPGWVHTGLADFEDKAPDTVKQANAKSAASRQAQERDVAVRKMVADSIGPEKIAEIVVEAVTEGRFYIFPHPERKADIRVRMETILEERIPSFGPPPPK
ncbi:MAG: SDR family NAD(P)-dependent oxidoreductase [Acidobacteria bacterium]|nr:SDR family NAD(P)-dependent oxidoreductase [Acidobacteriota bacterium]MDA1235285.1 SDR family NAD(P)-dependent oxidoreductase [Acidobacteriota bacterium]